jgi:hypothetical protein
LLGGCSRWVVGGVIVGVVGAGGEVRRGLGGVVVVEGAGVEPLVEVVAVGGDVTGWELVAGVGGAVVEGVEACECEVVEVLCVFVVEVE